MTNIIKFEEQKQQLEYLKGLALTASKSGNYSGMNEANLLNLMLSARDLGISPMKAINGGFYVVNGKICMSTSLMVDRIRREKHSIKVTEWSEEKCVIIGVRKDNGDSLKIEFTMKDAERAALHNSPTWKKWPKNMLYNRAMSTLARMLFPDVVGACYSEDEANDIKNIAPENRQEKDPEEEGTIEIPLLEEKQERLTEDQKEELEFFLEEYPELMQRLLSWLSVDKTEDIQSKDFPKLKKAMENYRKKNEEVA